MGWSGRVTASMNEQVRKGVIEAIVTESAPVLQRYSDPSGTAFELSTNLTTATG